jgi:hypothetical protein
MQNLIRNSYNVCLKTTPAKSVQPFKYCFEKTNPISKMQNERNTLHSKMLQDRDIPPPPKNKTNQNQNLLYLRSNPREDASMAVQKETYPYSRLLPPKFFQFLTPFFYNLSHFVILFPSIIFTFYIFFTLYHRKFACLFYLTITDLHLFFPFFSLDIALFFTRC